MALRIADAAVDKVYVGGDAVDKVYVGSDLVWEAAVLTNMRMDKSGTQASLATGKITSWTGTAGSNVVNDELVANGPGTRTAYAQVQNSSGVPGNSTFELMLNDTVISTVTGGIGTLTFPTVSGALALGDRLWMRKTSGNARTIGTATFIYWA